MELFVMYCVTVVTMPAGIFAVFVKHVRDVAVANARGVAYGDWGHTWGSYATSEVEHKARLELQHKVSSHADGGPFYCNAFTGWRKKVYKKAYVKTLEKDKRKQLKLSLQHERQKKELSLEMKRVNNLELESLVVTNMREVKN